MLYLFNTLIYYPIVNVLVFLYNTVAFGDFGIAIIILTIIIRLCLAPMSHKMLCQQATMQKIKPEMLEIQKKYKDDKKKQAVLLMEFYKKHKINPLYTFLVLLIQLPILWALFKAFTNGLNGQITYILYPFVSYPGVFNPIAFGVINLNERYILFILLVAISQFIQIKLSFPSSKNITHSKIPMPSGNTMGIILALFTAFVLWGLPTAMAIYWFVTTIFSIGQQLICNKLMKNAELKKNNS